MNEALELYRMDFAEADGKTVILTGKNLPFQIGELKRFQIVGGEIQIVLSEDVMKNRRQHELESAGFWALLKQAFGFEP